MIKGRLRFGNVFHHVTVFMLDTQELNITFYNATVSLSILNRR